MAKLTKCCCGCECLLAEDLPDVAITNHTGGGWTGECCFEQIFTPNTTPSWSKSCTGLLYEASVSEQCITEHWTQANFAYRGFEYFTGDDCNTIPEDYCCPGAYEKIATTTTNGEWVDNGFMALWKRPKHIIVRISREEVNCDEVQGQTGGCKLVIRSRYVYEYKTKFYRNELNWSWQSVDLHNQDCFEIDQDFVIEESIPTPITCNDVALSPPTSADPCMSSGEFYFDRVRYYDNMPTGSIDFTNIHIPGCTANACDYSPYNYASSVCIYSPSAPIIPGIDVNGGCFFDQPCYCTETVFQVESTHTYGPTICGGENVMITSFGGCDMVPCIPFLCDVILTECDLDQYECPASSYTSNCSSFDIDPENPATCYRQGFGFALGDFNACGCSNSLGGVGEDPPPYNRTVFCDDPTSCNTTCCQYFDDCECCHPDGRCRQIHAGYWWQTVAEHTRTQTCSGFSSQSICTNAPSWTITLS